MYLPTIPVYWYYYSKYFTPNLPGWRTEMAKAMLPRGDGRQARINRGEALRVALE
jgi:hypothetical protein